MRAHLKLIGAALLAFAPGCGDDDDHHHHTIPVTVTGTDAADFQTLTDYVTHPVVEDIFRFMPRHTGATPPNVDGRYLSTGSVIASSTPGHNVGDTVSDEFCFGPPAGDAIEVAVSDPSVVSAGARPFIEGTGDFFTIYTAFKSVQTGPGGFTCEDHQVVVFSGRRLGTGALADLFIGFGIVGLVGDCGNLAVGDIQVSQNTASLEGASCVGGSTPLDPTKVLVSVENFLVTDADVFADGALVGTAPFLSSITFEAVPGFTITASTVQPGGMGKSLDYTFTQDTQEAGRFSQYTLSNVIGSDTFFAPVVVNATSGTVRVTVQSSPTGDSGDLPRNDNVQFVMGYYDFNTATVSPGDVSVTVTRPEPPSPITILGTSPSFILGLDSGSLSLLVTPTSPSP